MNNDLISRKYMKEAIEQFFEMVKYYHPHSKGRKTIPTEEVLDIIDNAPTVEPKLKDDIIEAFNLITDQEFEHSDSFWIETPKGKKIEFEKKRPQGKWGKWVISEIQCPNCFEYFQTDCYSTEELKKCPNCGADMRGGV